MMAHHYFRNLARLTAAAAEGLTRGPHPAAGHMTGGDRAAATAAAVVLLQLQLAGLAAAGYVTNSASSAGDSIVSGSSGENLVRAR